MQAVEQQPLLQRRQRQDVLDFAQVQVQCGQTGAVQAAQREVRRRGAGHARLHAVFDQGTQLVGEMSGQDLDGRGVVHGLAEAETDAQLALVDLPFHAQPVGQRRVVVLALAGTLRVRLPQRAGVELTVELAQVVEGDPRLRQARQLLAHSCRAQVAQNAIAQATGRHGAQLFLDC
ncbi:hypothetical protein D3C76_1205050 [compost metagenome]